MFDDFVFNFDSAEGIYTWIAVFSTVLVAAMTLVSSFAGDFGHDADVSGDGADEVHGGGDTPIFTVRSVLGFMLGFGWGGLCTVEWGVAGSLACAVLLGAVMFGVVLVLMRWIYSLHSSGNFETSSLVGKMAVVYVTLPALRGSGGQIQVETPSGLRFYPAVTDSEQELKAGTPVLITEVGQGLVTVSVAA